jgi:ribosome-associated toxin RatA of RatAB toxin-antitoxin module
MGAHRAEHTEVAAATADEVFDVVADFDDYPSWSSNVIEANVLETGDDGRASVVEFLTDAKVRKIRYVLRYHWEPPARIWWEYVEGDAKSVDGEYELEPVDGGISITYRLAIDPGTFMPGPVKKILVESVMKGSVKDLKKRVEEG